MSGVHKNNTNVINWLPSLQIRICSGHSSAFSHLYRLSARAKAMCARMRVPAKVTLRCWERTSPPQEEGQDIPTCQRCSGTHFPQLFPAAQSSHTSSEVKRPPPPVIILPSPVALSGLTTGPFPSLSFSPASSLCELSPLVFSRTPLCLYKFHPPSGPIFTPFTDPQTSF